MWVDMTSAALRAMSFVAVLQAAGVALFLGVFTADTGAAEAGVRRMAVCSAWAGVVLVVLHHVLEAARMTGEFSGVLSGDMQILTLHSVRGASNALRLAGLIMIAASAGRYSALRNTLGIMGAVCVGCSFLLVGHSIAHAERWLIAPLLLLHVLIASFWFGSLLPLFLASKSDSAQRSAALAESFSVIATRTVPLIAVAGLVMTCLLLPNVAALLEPYGLLLLVKISGFSALMGLAALNKWRLAPALAAGRPDAVTAFQRSVLLEYGLICLVLMATAVMTSFFSPDSSG